MFYFSVWNYLNFWFLPYFSPLPFQHWPHVTNSRWCILLRITGQNSSFQKKGVRPLDRVKTTPRVFCSRVCEFAVKRYFFPQSCAARTLLGISGMKHVLPILVGPGASPWAPSISSVGTPAPFHTAAGSWPASTPPTVYSPDILLSII